MQAPPRGIDVNIDMWVCFDEQNYASESEEFIIVDRRFLLHDQLNFLLYFCFVLLNIALLHLPLTI